MINIVNLCKDYGQKKALDNVSFTINEGEIFGLLGHNGAGKTTTMSILVSIINQTSGKIEIDGTDIRLDRMKAKKMISYVSDSPDKFLKMTARYYWEFVALVYGIDKGSAMDYAKKLCNRFNLNDVEYSFIESLSHGIRQKVFLIGSLISNPKIWILDEPMTGLDPQSSYELKEIMKERKNENNTVIFSTHVLEVAEKVCDRIAILSQGKLIFVGTLEELKYMNPGKGLEEIYLSLTTNGDLTNLEDR